MVEALDSSEEAKKNLLQEIAALRKQSVIALVLAVLFILITVYLYFQLQGSKESLRESYTQLKNSEEQLEAQNLKIKSLNAELDTFRQTILAAERPPEVAAPPVMSAPSPGFTPRYNNEQYVVESGTQACLGYIIYIQDRRGSKVSAALRKTLKDKGAIVPAIEHIAPSRAFRSSIRYFHEGDEKIATYLQEVALATLGAEKVSYSARQLPIQFIPNKKVPLGQLEVWIDQ
ncbi:MAG: hypothetical protein KKG00_14105 [Bacteroidetes bacterium]|nr:hypothetical protein [Bacteroidota bacterium]